jgi:hypothetical protein
MHVMLAYTVTCEFDDPAVADQWIAWLREEHLAEVCAAGALDAEVVRFDGSQDPVGAGERVRVRCEVRYHFASRDAFAAYERDHAARLRAAGLELFPPQRGIRYSRSIGAVAVQFAPP